MSIKNPDFAKADIIPVVETDLFAESPTSQFALGILAVGDVTLEGRDDLYRSYFDLRRNVYVDETGQLSPADINEDGTDRDIDDSRSVAFGAFENLGNGLARTVGSLRLIMKGYGADSKEQRQLPVEEFCPEIFEENPVPTQSTEVSRLIARHERARLQDILKWKMYSAGLAYINNHDLGPTYAVVEPGFEDHLRQTIPMARIGEPRYIEHYLDVNTPIQVFTNEFSALVEQKHPGTLEQLRKFEGEMSFFGKTAVRPTIGGAPATVIA